MADLLPQIRNAVRAVIIHDNHILMLRKTGGGKPERFALPGGGQNPGETLSQALQRECLEEINTEVRIKRLRHIGDFFKLRDSSPPTIRQHVDFYFECSVPADYIPENGNHPDRHQVEVTWLDLDKINDHVLYPKSLSGLLEGMISGNETTYIGTVD